MTYKELENNEIESIDCGIYNISGIARLEFASDGEISKKMKIALQEFIQKYPDCVLAEGYEADNRFLLATMPL